MVQAAGDHSYAGVESPGELCFCKCKTNELLCLSGRHWKPEQQRAKGNKYHSAKAKNDQIRRDIMNNSFDLIESDPGNVYKYMEYMTMLYAAHES